MPHNREDKGGACHTWMPDAVRKTAQSLADGGACHVPARRRVALATPEREASSPEGHPRGGPRSLSLADHLEPDDDGVVGGESLRHAGHDDAADADAASATFYAQQLRNRLGLLPV